MERWHLIIDVEKCEDCNNCFLACKDEHVGNAWPGYAAPQPVHGQRWIDILRRERGSYPLIDVAYKPVTCLQCDDAPCVAAGDAAARRREDGIVLLDPSAARGRRDLVDACPQGMIWWNETEQVPQKCTLCAHLLDQGWKQTRCVQACPTGALELVKLTEEDFALLAEREGLEGLHPGEPPGLVSYKNLYRFHTSFIAGSVELTDPATGLTDCAGGAQVELRRAGDLLATTTSDAFGDFKFDRLEAGSGAYQVRVSLAGAGQAEAAVQLGESQSLSISLSPAAAQEDPRP
jgi:Fe-S-cluster-containing dehydrogenase component